MSNSRFLLFILIISAFRLQAHNMDTAIVNPIKPNGLPVWKEAWLATPNADLPDNICALGMGNVGISNPNTDEYVELFSNVVYD